MKSQKRTEREHETSPKINIWMIATIVLAIALVAAAAYYNSRGTGKVSSITSEQAGKSAVDYINTNLAQGGNKATLVSVEESNGLYKVTTTYQGQQIPVYLTEDGTYLFVSQPLKISEKLDLNPTTTEQQNQKVNVSTDGDPTQGSQTAPVTIVEFSDFQCPYCERFYTQTLPDIETNYIKTGKAKLVFRDFPLSFHQYAEKASEAAECAYDQSKFWEYHNKLFENQGALDVASLKKYAQDLGLDTAKFNTCLDSGTKAAEVNKDLSDGTKYGVTGTPSFFINGIQLTGAQPFSAFQQIIEQELKGK